MGLVPDLAVTGECSSYPAIGGNLDLPRDRSLCIWEFASALISAGDYFRMSRCVSFTLNPARDRRLRISPAIITER
jgi:hypothetical protein